MNKNIRSSANKKPMFNRSPGGDFFIQKNAKLYLQDGATFSGKSPAWQHENVVGEVVFNTGMSGYVESLTDPSYSGQILVFTYPLIGNYGVDPEDSESGQIQASGVIVSEAATHYSHARAKMSLLAWLHTQKIPILTGVDTRALTKHLRTSGTMLGSFGVQRPATLKNMTYQLRPQPLRKPIIHNEGQAKKVILVDCGAKDNILQSLLALRVQVKQVPLDYDYSQEPYDGVLLSNGPGDPTDYPQTIRIAQQAMNRGKPVFGICLGSQIMGLAAGAQTYKLIFGHRGHNQPCIETTTERCSITSQNHGYAIDENTLPTGWRVSWRNLNDNSVEGIEHKTKPFFSVQFHPEACPGPTDTAWLFNKFYSCL